MADYDASDHSTTTYSRIGGLSEIGITPSASAVFSAYSGNVLAAGETVKIGELPYGNIVLRCWIDVTTSSRTDENRFDYLLFGTENDKGKYGRFQVGGNVTGMVFSGMPPSTIYEDELTISPESRMGRSAIQALEYTIRFTIAKIN